MQTNYSRIPCSSFSEKTHKTLTLIREKISTMQNFLMNQAKQRKLTLVPETSKLRGASRQPQQNAF